MKSVEAKDWSSHSCSVLSEVEMRCRSDQTGSEVRKLLAASVGFEPASRDCEHLPTTDWIRWYKLVVLFLWVTPLQVKTVVN